MKTVLIASYSIILAGLTATALSELRLPEETRVTQESSSATQRLPDVTQDMSALSPGPWVALPFRPPYRSIHDDKAKQEVQAEVDAFLAANRPSISKSSSNDYKGVFKTQSGVDLVVKASSNLQPGCQVEVSASSSWHGDLFYWWMDIPDGTEVSIGWTKTGVVSFSLNQQHYGSGSYIVHADVYLFDLNYNAYLLTTPDSDPVSVNFIGSAGGNLHAVSVSPTSVKGGNNQQEPTLWVSLDAPAGPCGQRVYLTTSNSNLAWIMGEGYFTIPEGKTSEGISWFLGTKNVTFNKSVDVIVDVNGSKGYAKLELKK